LQPGGHRFEPGILHHVWRNAVTALHGQASGRAVCGGVNELESLFGALELAEASSRARMKSFAPKPARNAVAAFR
jgi:hypothetical protein